jgi:hypothetical protein
MKRLLLVFALIFLGMLAIGAPVAWVPVVLGLQMAQETANGRPPPRPACVYHTPPGTTPVARSQVPADVQAEIDAAVPPRVICAP